MRPVAICDANVPYPSTRRLMNAALRDVLVTGYEQHIDSVQLPDPGDQHVLAAALGVGADVIITKNLSDFPAELLAARGVRAVHPDVFLLDLVRQDTETVHAIVVAIAAAWKDPCATVVDVAASLAFEAPLSAEALRRHLGQSR